MNSKKEAVAGKVVNKELPSSRGLRGKEGSGGHSLQSVHKSSSRRGVVGALNAGLVIESLRAGK